jgi:hypothetical protein
VPSCAELVENFLLYNVHNPAVPPYTTSCGGGALLTRVLRYDDVSC